MPTLHAIECWMLSIITHPNGVSEAMDNLTARQHIDMTSERLNEVVRSSDTWSAADRLNIYWNAYFARLQDCLRDEFPVLRVCLEDELFDDFIGGYLQAYPPSSYTLGQLGRRFADYLSATRPSRDDATSLPDWADFIAELAHFEWTISDVFDGPGIERTPRPPHQSLDFSHDQLDDLTFRFAPCLRLCTYQFPVPVYHAAVKAGEAREPFVPRATFVAVTRQEFTVKHYPLAATEYSLLKRLQNGESLGTALDAICADDSASLTEVDQNISHWFAKWSRAEFIVQTSASTI
jgi:hypothetical protein